MNDLTNMNNLSSTGDSLSLDDLLTLGSLTDEQKMWLTQISYVDFTQEGKSLLENNNEIKISDLINYVDRTEKSENIINTLIELGLGDIKITNYADGKLFAPGFQALTFTDSFGNVGISYRGSDTDISFNSLDDWLNANLREWFYSNSEQSECAIKYFEENKSTEGNTYLYGHSLGGNLTSHVFLEHFDEIEQAFVINPNPIRESFINTQEEISAFNDPNKFSYNVICGDIVAHLKSCDKYINNVNFIHNVDYTNNNLIDAHSVDAADIDDNGSFNVIENEQVEIERMAVFKNSFLSFGNLLLGKSSDLAVSSSKGASASSALKNREGLVAGIGESLESLQKTFDKYGFGSLSLHPDETKDAQIDTKESKARVIIIPDDQVLDNTNLANQIGNDIHVMKM